MENNEIVTTGDGFIDRSKVRILLCDNDAKSSEEVFTLLCKCSYQVISVRSPRQVIDALNAEGSHIDLILSEVDLPMSNGFKILKYIMRDKQLRRIPVIMMSSQDEVSIVVKCLKFGAAEYLVKPLQTNELLNLWTHTWRRRRMLSLAEKNILSYDFDLTVSEPSNPNTNSTTLFSDDTDDKSWKSVNPEMCLSTMLQEEARYKSNAATNAAPVETVVMVPSECQPDAPGTDDRRTDEFQLRYMLVLKGEISSFPKKSELKIGEFSAFFTYVKSSLPKNNGQEATSVHQSAPQKLRIEGETSLGGHVRIDTKLQVTIDVVESHLQGNGYPSSNNIPKSFSIERPCTLPVSQVPHYRNSKDGGILSGAYASPR